MQEIKESPARYASSVSPEWELFRILQTMNWTDLSRTPEPALMDMYRSVELGLNLHKAITSPKLKYLADKYGQDMVCRLIGLTIQVYLDRFPARPEAKWGAWRLRQMAEWLYQTYTMESLRDVMYAFRRVQNLYIPDLAQIMTQYLDWRASKLEEIYQAGNRSETSEWPGELKEKLPERWFLGYLTQPHGNNNQHAA